MQSLRSTDVLRLWEAGQHAYPIEVAVFLLTAAFPDADPAAILNLTIGQGDAYLLEFRSRNMGTAILGGSVCPKCTTRIEFELDAENLKLMDPRQPPVREYWFRIENLEVRFRLLTMGDLLSVRSASDMERARQNLIRSSILEMRVSGVAANAEDLPDSIIEAIGEAIRDRDPQSEIRLQLSCPECRHQWSVWFDVATFFQKELRRQAERILDEVHVLAHAYGWTEQAVLSMTQQRRRFYLAGLNQ